MKVQRVHYLNLLPALILLALGIWQIVSYNNYSGLPDIRQLFFLALTFIMAYVALFFWGAGSPAMKYIEGLVDHLRNFLIAASCVLIGGIHMLSVLGQEPVYVQMGFVIIILAYYEAASISVNFRAHYSVSMNETTRGTIHRLLVGQMGKLGMVFALSVIMLYLSLMVIVGFTDPATVGVLAALMILAISFMTLVRRL